MPKASFWTRLVSLLGAVNLAAGLAAFFMTYNEGADLKDETSPFINHLVRLLPFAAAAALLIIGGYRDRRAVILGNFFLVIATAQSNRPLRLAYDGDYPGAELFGFINAIELDCMMALFLWMFVRDFPGPALSVRLRRWIAAGVWLSAAFAAFLLTANLLFYFGQWLFPQTKALAFLSNFTPQRSAGEYYGTVIPLAAAALPFLWWKARSAREPEQRRAQLFLQGLVIGLTPVAIDLLLGFIPAYIALLERSAALNLATELLINLALLALAFFTSHAVLVHHVLDVKLIARRALQYALARYSALTLAAVPLVALAYYLYSHSDERVRDLLSGPRLLLLVSASVLGLATLRYRKTLLDNIDRRFFREQYDARQILTLLVERIRSVSDVADLAKLVCREIDLALHLESVAVLAVEARSGLLVDPRNRARRLDASSRLALHIAGASVPLDITLEGAHTLFSKLPEREQHWLVDSGMRLIVPILSRDGSLLGMIGLGEKKSGLPFLHEDRQLLHVIASNAAWVLELAHTHSTPPPRSRFPQIAQEAPVSEPLAVAEVGKECALCGTVYQSFTIFCGNCSRRLETSHVPYVLPGKFRFERRIGAGGMGVVYRGADLVLGRPVAVKTLRRVSPEDAMRLRREARTAAAVAHPHLAAVYGMETWQGTPMLVLELLEGGTLAQRFEKGKLTAIETVELGISMSEALAQLHAADILHRDVKPSNIGFTRNGIPKLMDFGIARLMFDLRREGDSEGGPGLDDSGILPPTSIWNQTADSFSKQVVGTLSYLSPEALSHRPADVSFDLWGLAIVLYECLLGRKVFTGGDVRQIINRIKSGRVPDFGLVCPEHEPLLGDFFRSALHPTLSRRPASALELRRRLVEIRSRLETA